VLSSWSKRAKVGVAKVYIPGDDEDDRGSLAVR
jgi:hypothetical protein